MIIDDRDVSAKLEPDIEKLGEACLVLTAFECKEQAKPVVDVLIAEHLASCVQLHDVESTYVWKGEVVRTTEIVASIRTMTGVYPKLKERLTKLHPYELPEIIQIPVADGLRTSIGLLEIQFEAVCRIPQRNDKKRHEDAGIEFATSCEF